jgi:hypothetical protein
MIFRLSLCAVEGAECLHFKEDKHEKKDGKTQWKNLGMSLVEL